MKPIDTIRGLWKHGVWADRLVFRTLEVAQPAPEEAIRELAHILGTQENWLARLERREPRSAVWPEVTADEIGQLLETTHEACAAFIESLGEAQLDEPVSYTNSAGDHFTDSVGDILLHVALHGQYHRGKLNQLLRKAGATPAATDYIAFVRGAPAATEATSRR